MAWLAVLGACRAAPPQAEEPPPPVAPTPTTAESTGSTASGPSADTRPDAGPVPTLQRVAPEGPSVEVFVDDHSLGHVPIGELVDEVPLDALLPTTTAQPTTWHAISAKRSATHTFRLRQPVASLQGALPYLRATAPDRAELYFQRTVNPALPDHVARLAAAPTHTVAGIQSVHVHTVAPPTEETVGIPFTVTTPDGPPHPVSDALLDSLPRVTDPERPDRETGNWHRLDDLVETLSAAPPTADRPWALRVQAVGGSVTELDAADVRGLTLLLKRNQKGHVVLRGWRVESTPAERVVSVPQVEVLAFRVESADSP